MSEVQLIQAVISEFPGGSVLAALVDEIPAVRYKKVGRMLLYAVELLDDPESAVAERVRSDPRVARLLWEASEAAAQAESDEKLRALAAVAASGIRDEALLDEALYTVGVLKQLDVIHIRLLNALDDEDEGVDVANALNVSAGVAEALCADLLRAALVEALGLSFRGVHNQVKLSAFGREALRLLRTGEWERAVPSG